MGTGTRAVVYSYALCLLHRHSDGDLCAVCGKSSGSAHLCHELGVANGLHLEEFGSGARAHCRLDHELVDLEVVLLVASVRVRVMWFS